MAQTKITVHFVDEGTDTGTIIAQKEVNLKGTKTLSEVKLLISSPNAMEIAEDKLLKMKAALTGKPYVSKLGIVKPVVVKIPPSTTKISIKQQQSNQKQYLKWDYRN